MKRFRSNRNHSPPMVLNNLTPVNNSCERALGLATTFNGMITKDETSFQELPQKEVRAAEEERFEEADVI